jgi:outer membrane protein TolC
LDIVGQYALLARFNNYDDYFRRFQRHNWQAGVAVEIPIFTGRGVAERVASARLDERELSLRKSAKRDALALAAQRAEAALGAAERGRALAGQELAYARKSLDVLLAQFDEGRIALDELQRGRLEESVAWGGLVAAEYELAKARLGSVYAAGRIRDAFAD